MEQILLGPTYRCLKKKVRERPVAIEDKPHLTHLISEMIGPVNKGTAACFDTANAFKKVSHTILTGILTISHSQTGGK